MKGVQDYRINRQTYHLDLRDQRDRKGLILKLAVKVVDIFGNDTMMILEVKI
ncbi:MAG: hypothetical protein QME07_05790 [bacterium]|nr:hypothetical protein [bacterium]